MTDRLVRTLTVAVLGVVILGVTMAGVLLDRGAATLVLAATALLGAIAGLWASLQALLGNAPMTIEEAIAFAHASEAEERKRAILQALKDLQFDHSVGKIGQSDYDMLVLSFRGQAKRLLRSMDEDVASRRAAASAYVAEHRVKEKTGVPR